MSDGIPSPNSTYKQDIHNVSGEIKDVIGNKNLFEDDFSKYTKPYDYYICPIKLEVGQRYYFGINKIGQDISGCLVGLAPFGERYSDFSNKFIPVLRTNGSTNSQAIMITEEYTAPKLIFFGTQEQFESILENYEIQLEQGTTATSYVPHEQQTLPFTLEQGQKMYKGDYLADDGIHHVRGEVVFDGSNDENWSTTGSYTFRVSVTNKAPTNNLLCNSFTNSISWSSSSETYRGKVNGTDTIYIKFMPLTDMTLAEWKDLLAENPITVEYELEQEVIDPYTQTQQAQYNAIKKAYSYKDTTVITLTSDDAEPLTNVVAVADMSNALNIINARLDLLEE